MSDLKPLHQDHQVEVPRRVWNQIEGKMTGEKQRRKLFRLRAVSAIAACFVFAAVLSYINFNITHQNPKSFATNGTYKSMVFEDLSEPTSLIYNYNQLKEINSLVLSTNPSFGKRNR